MTVLFLYHFFKKENRKIKCTKIVKAKVFEVVRKRINEHNDDIRTRGYVYYPVFEYNVDGRYYKKKHARSKKKNQYLPGQRVDLCYIPQKPEQYIISGENISLAYIIFTVVGVFLIFYAYIFMKIM